MFGALRAEVADEIGKQSGFLIELHGWGEAVILDVLIQYLGGLCLSIDGEIKIRLHGLFVGTIKRVAEVVGFGDVVSQQTFL